MFCWFEKTYASNGRLASIVFSRDAWKNHDRCKRAKPRIEFVINGVVRKLSLRFSFLSQTCNARASFGHLVEKEIKKYPNTKQTKQMYCPGPCQRNTWNVSKQQRYGLLLVRVQLEEHLTQNANICHPSENASRAVLLMTVEPAILWGATRADWIYAVVCDNSFPTK